MGVTYQSDATESADFASDDSPVLIEAEHEILFKEPLPPVRPGVSVTGSFDMNEFGRRRLVRGRLEAALNDTAEQPAMDFDRPVAYRLDMLAIGQR